MPAARLSKYARVCLESSGCLEETARPGCVLFERFECGRFFLQPFVNQEDRIGWSSCHFSTAWAVFRLLQFATQRFIGASTVVILARQASAALKRRWQTIQFYRFGVDQFPMINPRNSFLITILLAQGTQLFSAAPTATSYTFTGPSGGGLDTPSSSFTITPNAAYRGTVTIRTSGGGLSSPILLNFSNSPSTQTFTITPTAVGPVKLTTTNSGWLTNASPRTYATPPAAPLIGTATAGNGSVSVAFTAAASTGGSAITSYTASCSPGNITGTGAASPVVVNGLVNGTAYRCTATASNAAGTSAASSASNSVTSVAPATSITITPAIVPAHGSNYTLFTSRNVFSLTDAGRYSDGQIGDWKHWVATANDPTTASNGARYNAQDITIRNVSTTQKISGLSFTGVAGPAFSQFGSNAYFDWDSADNDNTGVDYSGSYFYFTGNGMPFVRPHGSSYMVINCADSASALIANCSERFTVTPNRSGPQNLYVWTRAEGANARLTVSTGSLTQTYDFPVRSSATADEMLFTVTIAPSDTATPYTVALSALSVQTGAPAGFLSITSVALGGANAGNVSDATLATTGYVGTPSHTYGVRTHQADPSVRIPAPILSRVLSLTESLQGAINTASCGTDLHLPTGYVSNERIVLPNKGCTDAAWVRIIADGARNIFGQRAQPADYPGGPQSPAILNWSGPETVISNDATNGDRAARAAHHYAFVGVEITSTKATYTVNYALVSFNAGPSPTMASISHDIIFQNCYIHRHSSQENSLNGIEFNVDRGAIYDSYIAGFQDNTHSFVNENHAVYWDSSNGPMTYRNNYLSAATECVITGGAPASPFVVTKDIEFDGNFFDKPSSYNTQLYPPYDVKNSLEFKQGQFVSVTNNVFEHGFSGYGQIGQAVFIRSYAFGGVQRRTTSNYLISNNIVRHHSTGFQVEAFDYYGLGGGTNSAKVPMHFTPRQYDILIANNSMEDFSFVKWGALGRNQGPTGSNLFFLSSLPVNLTLDHNTGLFDTATDNTAGYQDNDHSIIIPNLALLSKADTLSTFNAAYLSMNTAPDEATTSFVLTNNILSGGIHGDNYYGTYLLPSAATYNNNSLFNVPGYIANTFASKPLTNTSYTTSTTTPAVAG